MSPASLRVLISGAGITGPCLAYWLAKAPLNATITILERSQIPRVTGQAVDLEGPSVEIVRKMKLEEAILAKNTTEEGTAIVNKSGKPIAQFGRGDTFTSNYEILRADISQLFLDATTGLDRVRYRYGNYITSLEQSGKDVKVNFKSGASETFDVVAAADGSTSTTRPMILDETILKDSYKPIGQYVAFFSIPSRPGDNRLWEWYNAPKGLGVMTRPHRNSATRGAYLCITLPSRGQQDPVVEAAMREGTDGMKRMLHGYFDNAGWETKRILEGMDQADDFYMSRAAQVKLPKWTNGRALVLGDAAFATFGVGTAMGIESAYVLAGELSKIKSSDEVPQALERYEEVFRTLYSKRGDIPGLFPQAAFPQTTWGLGLRNSALWLAGKTRIHKLLPGDGAVDWKLPPYQWVGA